MIHVERTMTVSRPLPEVVAYLSDFTHTQDWDPGTVSCERTGEGPVEAGATWHNVSEFRGRRTELTYRLTTFEENRLVFTGENKTVEAADDLTFSTTGVETLITYRARIRFKGAAALAGPFLRREFERLGDEITRTLPKAVHAAVSP